MVISMRAQLVLLTLLAATGWLWSGADALRLRQKNSTGGGRTVLLRVRQVNERHPYFRSLSIRIGNGTAEVASLAALKQKLRILGPEDKMSWIVKNDRLLLSSDEDTLALKSWDQLEVWFSNSKSPTRAKTAQEFASYKWRTPSMPKKRSKRQAEPILDVQPDDVGSLTDLIPVDVTDPSPDASDPFPDISDPFPDVSDPLPDDVSDPFPDDVSDPFPDDVSNPFPDDVSDPSPDESDSFPEEPTDPLPDNAGPSFPDIAEPETGPGDPAGTPEPSPSPDVAGSWASNASEWSPPDGDQQPAGTGDQSGADDSGPTPDPDSQQSGGSTDGDSDGGASGGVSGGAGGDSSPEDDGPSDPPSEDRDGEGEEA